MLLSFIRRQSPMRMALASAIGLLGSMLPFPYHWWGLIAIVLIFRFNVLAVMVGAATAYLIPVIYMVVFWAENQLSGFNLPFAALLRTFPSPALDMGGMWGNLVWAIVVSVIAFPLFLWVYGFRRVGNDAANSEKTFVFFDRTGGRWVVFRRMLLMFLLVSVVVVTMFGLSLNQNPKFPELTFPRPSEMPALKPINEAVNDRYLTSKLRAEEKMHPTFQLGYAGHQKRPNQVTNGQEVYAFYVNWDSNSKSSLRRNIQAIDVLVPEWYHLQSNLTVSKEVQPDIVSLAAKHNVPVMPLINNNVGEQWDSASVDKLLHSEKARQAVIRDLYQDIASHHFAGINLDLESIPANDRALYASFVSEIASLFHAHGLKVTVDVPAADNAFDYANIAKAADRVMVMMYDEHDAGADPGPVASAPWFKQTLDNLGIPPQKLIVSLGNYGYDWQVGAHHPAETVSFADVMQMAHDSHLKIQWDSQFGNPYMQYEDGNEKHVIWFLDGVTFYNQMKMALDDGAKGVAMWRLGTEDPTVWKVLTRGLSPQQKVSELHDLVNSDPVRYVGEGEILRILSPVEQGKRNFVVNGNGLLDRESYDALPSPFTIQKYGKPKGKVVVLTFDDGPDPVYTKQILDILDRYHVKATFFVVGQNAALSPDLVVRMYREGHEIGSHTFTHPNVAAISPEQSKMELNANQRLIQELTGHSMTMFRPPFVADSNPSTPAELLPILRAQQLGYTMVGESIDPEDWAKPGSDVIVKRVMDQLSNGYGNIILLHDAGGDRSQTVQALPRIIEQIRKQGYQFVTISQLMGKPRSAVMPPVQPNERTFLEYDRAVFAGFADWNYFLYTMLAVSIGLGVFRLLFLLYFAARQRKKSRSAVYDSFTPFVSVVVAAYNEENVIAKTIRSILQSDYPHLEVVVVDDGSKDKTATVVKETFGHDPRVRLIRQPNGGKSSAICRGFKEAKGEFVVALDADTMIDKDAIAMLVRHFQDDRVAAVSGNVKVGNVHNLLTTWQHIEYVTGFNLERRAYAALNCVTVVPGAIGAWRKKAVLDAGLFKDDTLAEDTDMTLTLLRQGYRVEYEDRAIAYTESPEDLRSLLKQRYRWTYGTLQCLWKHRGALFRWKHGALGFVALPSMWLFQYVFQPLSAIADVLFIMGLFGNEPAKIIGYYFAFLAVDLFASWWAFHAENESPRPLLWLFLQRVVYRQYMTYVVCKSLFSALKGVAVGWNKLRRKGSVDEIEVQSRAG